MRKMHGVHAGVSERYHAEIGKRFRRVAAEICWDKIRHAFLGLQDAYEGIQYPAKLAHQEVILNTTEMMDVLNEESASLGGEIVKSACDLYRQLTTDIKRGRFCERLTAQRDRDNLSSDEIHQIAGPEIAETELGTRLVVAMDAFLKQLGEPVPSRYKPIHALALRFKTAVFSEFDKLEVARICQECGRVFAFTSPRKKFCSRVFENRDCAAKARNKRSYQKHAKSRMSRSESGKKAARIRWNSPADSAKLNSRSREP